jgi:hypothetical protein
MNHVNTATVPPLSRLHSIIEPGDFVDCYSVQSDLSVREAAEIVTRFPLWAKVLVNIRNVLVAPFGLTSEVTHTGRNTPDKIGMFPVEYEDELELELIAGFNDKHLNFRISVACRQGRIYLSTWVHTHNIGGKVYLNTILPFHTLIVRNALKRVKLNKKVRKDN